MELDSQQESSHIYYGKVGDFRNESMVRKLVDNLAIIKVKEIDEKAISNDETSERSSN